MTSDICLIPHVNGTEIDKTVAVLSAVARMHRARLQSKKRSHHVVTDCRSPVNPQTRGYHASSASEASHDTAIFTGSTRHLSPKSVAPTRGYSSDMEYAVHITPINKMNFDSSSTNLHGVSKSDSLMHLPLPTKKSQKSSNSIEPFFDKKPDKVFLSDQELSGIDSCHEDIVVKCKPKIQPKTYARTRLLPLMSETEDESSRAKRREPVSGRDIDNYQV